MLIAPPYIGPGQWVTGNWYGFFSRFLQTDNSNNQGKTRIKIREIIGRNPEVTIQEMAKEIGVTPKTIEWHIAKMKGVEIEREGPANGGHWILLKP